MKRTAKGALGSVGDLDQDPWDHPERMNIQNLSILLSCCENQSRLLMTSELRNISKQKARQLKALSFWKETVGAPLSSRSYDYESEAAGLQNGPGFWGMSGEK